jgi:hypothetical protein
MSLKDLAYKPRRTTVRIILDDELRQAVDEARERLNAQRRTEKSGEHGLGSKVPDLEAALVAAEAAADDAAQSFTFEALPRHRLAALVESCPPSAEELNRVRPPQFNVETFTPRLIAASLTEPETTEAEVVEMWQDGAWSDAIWGQLWSAAWGVNEQVSTRPTYGNASEKTPNTVPELSTP